MANMFEVVIAVGKRLRCRTLLNSVGDGIAKYNERAMCSEDVQKKHKNKGQVFVTEKICLPLIKR